MVVTGHGACQFLAQKRLPLHHLPEEPAAPELVQSCCYARAIPDPRPVCARTFHRIPHLRCAFAGMPVASVWLAGRRRPREHWRSQASETRGNMLGNAWVVVRRGVPGVWCRLPWSWPLT